MKLVLITAAFMAIMPTATALQTEVDPQTMEWKRKGLARWEHKKDRMEAEAAERAAAEEAEQAPVTASYPSGVLSAAQVAAYARGAGFPESVISTMVAIAYRESRFNPGAVNSSSGACGLWQSTLAPVHTLSIQRRTQRWHTRSTRLPA